MAKFSSFSTTEKNAIRDDYPKRAGKKQSWDQIENDFVRQMLDGHNRRVSDRVQKASVEGLSPMTKS